MTSLPVPVAFGAQIAAAASRHDLDPRLLAAVAAQETGGPGSDSGRNVIGDGGHGRGLFQIDDRSHAFARGPTAMDPARNADYAAGLLQSNLRRYGGDVKAALSAYNTGSPTATGTKTDWGDGRPLGYADSVLRHYSRLGGTGPAAASAQTGLAASGATAIASSPTDLSELTTALQALAGQLGTSASVMPFQLPQQQQPPLPQADQHTVTDAAPSTTGGDDGSDDSAAGATTT
jgi:hypothetical protein